MPSDEVEDRIPATYVPHELQRGGAQLPRAQFLEELEWVTRLNAAFRAAYLGARGGVDYIYIGTRETEMSR